MPNEPPTAPIAGEEKTLLLAQLDDKRAILLRKVGGMPETDLGRACTASSPSLLGLLKHSAYVERLWFRSVFAGEDVSFPWTDDDPDADFRLEPDDTAEEIAAMYRDEVQRSRAFVESAELEDRARNLAPGEDATLRGILLHMIQETSRHLGHADIIRETLDGATGD
jgi:uncharacterized damage-inducible protein DinB